MKLFQTSSRQKRGAALVEYALLVAGVALVSIAAISIFGHKTGSMIGASAAVLPGAQVEDNGVISVGRIADTVNNNGVITATTGADNNLGDNLGVNVDDLVTDPGN